MAGGFAISSAYDTSPVNVLPLVTDPALVEALASAREARTRDRKGTFVLGTRQSKLAVIQTEIVKAALLKRFPDMPVRIFGMTSSGDTNQSQPLYLLGGKALWTKELEVALLDGGVDAVVHSLKDVPTDFPEGCELGAILEREDPSDALVVKQGLPYRCLSEFPDGSVIGTSSVRRVAQLRRKYPRLKFADVRGLVQTRLRKLDDPSLPYTALILASAGLIRMGLESRITARVTSPALYHAVGQGAIGVEMRSNDPHAARIVGALEDWKTGWTTRAERSMLKELEGGCSVPVGCETFLVEEVDAALCPVVGASSPPRIGAGLLASSPRMDGHMMPNGISDGLPPGHPRRITSPHDPHSATLTLTGTVTSLAGTSAVIASQTRLIHSIAEAEALGIKIAHELVAAGGRAILEELGRHVKEVGGEDGKELPFESNRAINIPPPKTNGHSHSNGTGGPRSPQRTVFKEGAVCLRPQGW